MKPVWLLDIDGVINAASKKPDTSIWPGSEWRTARVLGLPLLVATPVVRFITEQHEAGRVDIRWHTTWQDDAPKVGAEFGLPDLPIADCPEFNSRLYDRAMNGRDTAWWKRPAVDRVLTDEQRPLIWTDDDVSRREADQVRALGVALVIAPNSYTGLTPKHLRQIGEFLDLHSPLTVAEGATL